MKAHTLSNLTRIVMASVLLAAQLTGVGCSKEPLKPKVQAGSRTAAGGSLSNSEEMPSGDDTGHQGAGAQYIPPNWHGGPGSLPMGPDITPQEVLAHVDTLRSVAAAKNEFASRGYVRHPELDSLCINGANSTVLLGYQKPGYNLQVAIAYIFVVSRRVTANVDAEIGDTNGHTWHETIPVTLYETQVGGGLISHTSADSVVYTSGAGDPPLQVVSVDDTPPPSITFTRNGYVMTISSLASAINGSSDIEWISDCDVLGWSPAQADVTFYISEAQAPDYFHQLEQANADAAVAIAVWSLGYIAGFSIAYLSGNPELAWPVQDLVIRQAIAAGLITGQAASALYWIPQSIGH